MYNVNVSILIAILLVLLILFIVPVIVYGLFSTFFGLKEPKKKKEFFIGVLIQKIGTSIGFVFLYHLGSGYFGEHWLTYSFVWVLMFAITEVGQTYLSNYSKKEALAGILSELLYFPFSGFVLSTIL